LAILQNNGFEEKGKYVLTTENIGIPITSMLLLAKESLDFINNEQNSLLENESNRVVDRLTQERFYKETLFSPPAAGLNVPEGFFWSKERVWSIDYRPTVSGSVVAYQSYIYKPSDAIQDLTTIWPTHNQNWVVYSGLVHSTLPLRSKNLIQIYKHIILFSELSYAVEERVGSEREIFEGHFEVKLPRVEMGGDFISVCGKRGGIIHGASFKLNIDPKSSELVFGKEGDDVASKYNSSFDEMIAWVDANYAAMKAHLLVDPQIAK
jgi:hypothetical protein